MNYAELKAKIDNGLSVAHEHVVEMFAVLNSGGSLEHALALQAALDTVNAKLAETQTAVKLANDANDALRAEAVATGQERDAAVANTLAANAFAQDAGAKLSAKTAEFDALKAEHDDALAELATAGDRIVALDAEMADLKAKLDAANAASEQTQPEPQPPADPATPSDPAPAPAPADGGTA